jgi:Protein of unknown function (DUF3892)
MLSRYQIICIRRSDRVNHDRRIRAIGGVNADGSRWQVSEEAAILGIEAGRWHFYLSEAGQQVEVIVATSRYGNKYLKAADDALHPDRLLALPDCR